MQVHSLMMELGLTGQKLINLCTKAVKFLGSETPPTIRDVSHLLKTEFSPPSDHSRASICRMLQRGLALVLDKGA